MIFSQIYSINYSSSSGGGRRYTNIIKRLLVVYWVFVVFDGIYYLISCGAIGVFPPRATLFAPPPPPRQSTSIATREKIMTCDSSLLNNSENSRPYRYYFKDQR